MDDTDAEDTDAVDGLTLLRTVFLVDFSSSSSSFKLMVPVSEGSSLLLAGVMLDCSRCCARAEDLESLDTVFFCGDKGGLEGAVAVAFAADGVDDDSDLKLEGFASSTNAAGDCRSIDLALESRFLGDGITAAAAVVGLASLSCPIDAFLESFLAGLTGKGATGNALSFSRFFLDCRWNDDNDETELETDTGFPVSGEVGKNPVLKPVGDLEASRARSN